MKSMYLEEFIYNLNTLIKDGELKDLAPELVYYGIKHINNTTNKVSTLEEAYERYDFFKLIFNLLEQVRVGYLINHFPLKEMSDGSTAEYYSTLRKIEEQGLSIYIEEPVHFLKNYSNQETLNFYSNFTKTLERIYFLKNQPAVIPLVIEDFKKTQSIGRCGIYRENGGKAYFSTLDGDTIPIKRSYPGYLRPIKGGLKSEWVESKI